MIPNRHHGNVVLVYNWFISKAYLPLNNQSLLQVMFWRGCNNMCLSAVSLWLMFKGDFMCHRSKLQTLLILFKYLWCLFLQICLHAGYILGWPEIWGWSGSLVHHSGTDKSKRENYLGRFFTYRGTLPKCHRCMRDGDSKRQHSDRKWIQSAAIVKVKAPLYI